MSFPLQFTKQTLFNLTLTKALDGHHHIHFTDEETEAHQDPKTLLD